MPSRNIHNQQLTQWLKTQWLKKDGPFPFQLAQQEFLPVFSVNHVHFTFIALNETQYLLITAFGMARTTGWSQAHLEPFIYVQPPLTVSGTLFLPPNLLQESLLRFCCRSRQPMS